MRFGVHLYVFCHIFIYNTGFLGDFMVCVFLIRISRVSLYDARFLWTELRRYCMGVYFHIAMIPRSAILNRKAAASQSRRRLYLYGNTVWCSETPAKRNAHKLPERPQNHEYFCV